MYRRMAWSFRGRFCLFIAMFFLVMESVEQFAHWVHIWVGSASTGVLAKWCTYWACKWSRGYPSEREVHLPLLELRFLLLFQEANFRRLVWMLANWTQLTARLPCAISRDFVATLTNHEVLLMNFKICYLPLVLLETTSFEKILTV